MGSELHFRIQLVNLKKKDERMEITDGSATDNQCQGCTTEAQILGSQSAKRVFVR